jgi:hypothetical protein
MNQTKTAPVIALFRSHRTCDICGSLLKNSSRVRHALCEIFDHIRKTHRKGFLRAIAGLNVTRSAHLLEKYDGSSDVIDLLSLLNEVRAAEPLNGIRWKETTAISIALFPLILND